MAHLNAGPIQSENDDETTLDPDGDGSRAGETDLPDETGEDGWRTAQDATDSMGDGTTGDRATGLTALPD